MTATLTAGNLHIPTELLKKHGLSVDARVEIEDRTEGIFISPSEPDKRKTYIGEPIESISDLAGILTKGDPVAELLRERALDRERDAAKFRSR